MLVSNLLLSICSAVSRLGRKACTTCFLKSRPAVGCQPQRLYFGFFLLPWYGAWRQLRSRDDSLDPRCEACLLAVVVEFRPILRQVFFERCFT